MDNWRLAHLLSLHKEDTSDQFVRYAIAQEYLKMEMNIDAIKYFEELRSLNPDYVGLYYHLAQAYKNVQDKNNALLIYNEGINIAQRLKDQHALSELMNARTNMDYE